MDTYVILLRALMPKGKNVVPMAPLRTALGEVGLADVRTYIQSGNVIARSALGQSDVEQLVHDVIAREFGGDITVLARSAEQFRRILAADPFPDAPPAQLFLTLLAAPPDPERVRAFLEPGYAPDEVRVIDDAVFVRVASSYSAVKANNAFIERKLKVAATTRVYTTVLRLAALIEG
jgi:uncharacterized protein (DUF1697 family)